MKGPAEGFTSMVHQVQLPLSKWTIEFVADLIRRCLVAIGSRCRLVPPAPQAVVALAVLHHDQRLSDMAGGNAVSASTIRRRAREVVALLDTRAPRLERALKKIKAGDGEAVLLDGTLIRTRRRTGRQNQRNYSTEHRAHGLLFLALTDVNATCSGSPRPGRAGRAKSPPRAATRSLFDDVRQAWEPWWTWDSTGLEDNLDDPVIVMGRRAAGTRPITAEQKRANKIVAGERAANEHAFADLKNWRVLTKLRMNAQPTTTLLRALLVLTRLKITRWQTINRRDHSPRPGDSHSREPVHRLPPAQSRMETTQ
nr:transposase family protein [Streptomyces virginiae]